MDENLCVCCGAVIPEGRQICSRCENIARVKGDWYSGEVIMKDGTKRYSSGTMSDVFAWAQSLLGSKHANEFRTVRIL